MMIGKVETQGLMITTVDISGFQAAVGWTGL